MALDARAVAMEGVGFGPLSMALGGFASVIVLLDRVNVVVVTVVRSQARDTVALSLVHLEPWTQVRASATAPGVDLTVPHAQVVVQEVSA